MKLIIRGKDRPQGTYIAGNPGFGKSSLIQNLALKDIDAGHGVTVIDPTSDLVDRILAHIPKHRVNDTILFDTKDPIPIDFFSYRDRMERRVLTDQLLNIFSLDKAPISKPLLEQVIATLFDANDNGGNSTFLDIQNFIEDKERREEILCYAPDRRKKWSYFPKISEFASILGRIQPFTEFPLNRIFEAKKPKLNIWNVIQEKKILLINLHETSTDYFIASLIASKFQQAIFGRAEIPRNERHPYYLYIDECHRVLEYAVKEFETILTGARKYNLCYTIANQIPSDLPKEVQRKLGLIQTLFLFNLEENDALIFKSRLGYYRPEYLLSLGKFRAISRTSGNVRLVKTPKFLGYSKASYAKSIKKRTVDLYGLPHSKEPVELSQDGNPSPPPTEDEPPTLQPDKPKPRHP